MGGTFRHFEAVSKLIMPPKKLIVLLAAFTLAAAPDPASAAFVNYNFQSGYSLFGNPLNAADNHVSSILAAAPAGSTVSLWDTGLAQYTPTASFNGVTWSGDFVLAPGTGALLYSPSPFLNTYVGSVLDADGSPYDFLTVHLPPPAPLLTGFHLVSSRLPFTTGSFGGYSLFEHIFGRLPEDEVYFMRFDSTTQNFTQPLISVGGDFYTSDFSMIMNPSLNVGEAGFFFVGGGVPTLPEIIVPEPGCLALLGVGLAAALFPNRARRR
jgi:hypothetical protein